MLVLRQRSLSSLAQVGVSKIIRTFLFELYNAIQKLVADLSALWLYRWPWVPWLKLSCHSQKHPAEPSHPSPVVSPSTFIRLPRNSLNEIPRKRLGYRELIHRLIVRMVDWWWWLGPWLGLINVDIPILCVAFALIVASDSCLLRGGELTMISNEWPSR